jgi:hypothetical protein
MWRLALFLVLVLAACGADETGESGSCASGIVYQDAAYLGVGDVDGLPPPTASAEEAARPGCNDGGPIESDTMIEARHMRGVAPEVALYAGEDAYVNVGYFTELPEHPLHRQFHGAPDRPRRRARGEPCQIEGRVLETTFSLMVRAADQRISVAVDARTTIAGFDRAGLPYLEEGDKLRIGGRACHDGDPPVVLARLIEPGR